MKKNSYFYKLLPIILYCIMITPTISSLISYTEDNHISINILSNGWVADYYQPYPESKLFVQPDGTSFQGIIQGKEIGGGVKTTDGYTAIKNTNDW